jgi:hypothetical protein
MIFDIASEFFPSHGDLQERCGKLGIPAVGGEFMGFLRRAEIAFAPLFRPLLIVHCQHSPLANLPVHARSKLPGPYWFCDNSVT